MFTRIKSIGLAHYYQLQSTLVNLNQDLGQSVNEYLAVLQLIWTQLDEVKISTNHIRLIKILMELYPKYESVRTALITTSQFLALIGYNYPRDFILEKNILASFPPKNQMLFLQALIYPMEQQPYFVKNCKLSGSN